MTARTVAVLRALAQAGEKGLAHIAAQQDTGTWLATCGRQVRGRDIRTDAGPAAGEHAEHLGAGFCPDCADLALTVADTIAGGVALLLRHGTPAQAGVQLASIPTGDVRVAAGRRTADESLVDSVRQQGVVQPVSLRRTADGLELVVGARRLDAARAAGLTTVPALVRDATDEQAILEALTENLHRADLNPIEQAVAYRDAIDRLGITQASLARRLSLSCPQVSNTLRLLGLPEHLREQVAAGVLTAAHGRALLRVDSDVQRDAIAAQIAAEGLTTKDTDAVVRAAHARRTPPAGADFAAVARLLAGILEAPVRVTPSPGGSRIVIDVPTADLARVLEQLGVRDAAPVKAA